MLYCTRCTRYLAEAGPVPVCDVYRGRVAATAMATAYISHTVHHTLAFAHAKEGATLREGSRRMSASHGTLPAIAIGTADGSPPVPVEGPMRIRCPADELCAPSACAGSERSQPGRGKVCGRARRRALRARCSRLVS